MDVKLDSNRGIEIIGNMRQFEFMCLCPDKPQWTIRSRLDRKFSVLTCDYCGEDYKIIYPQGGKHGE